MPMLVTALMNALAVLTAVLALLARATAALVLDTGAYISLPRTREGLGTVQAGAGVSQGQGRRDGGEEKTDGHC